MKIYELKKWKRFNTFYAATGEKCIVTYCTKGYDREQTFMGDKLIKTRWECMGREVPEPPNCVTV